MNNTQASRRADARNCKPSADSDNQASKAQAVRSALENVVRSTDPVIEGLETLDDWTVHCDTVVRRLSPVGALETAYARRAALYLWRLDRVVRYEITATQFDLDDVIHEFFISLEKPELARDRSEGVTLEKLREPIGDFLTEFARWGADAKKLPDQKEGVAKIRGEAKRIMERRILPDRSTIETIIKYEAHLDRCLARTMAELRRLQKERRQGLREIEELVATPEEAVEESYREIEPEQTPARPTPCAPGEDVSMSAPLHATANLAMSRRNDEETKALSASRPHGADIPTSEPLKGMANLAVSRLNDRQNPALRDESLAKTHTNIKQAHQFAAATRPPAEPPTHVNPNRTPLDRISNSQYSAVPEVVVRPGPIEFESRFHSKE